MALNGLFCADVPLRNYSLTHVIVGVRSHLQFANYIPEPERHSPDFFWLQNTIAVYII